MSQENIEEQRQYIGSQAIPMLNDPLAVYNSPWEKFREKELALELFKSLPFWSRTVETFKECLMVVREKDLGEEFEGFEEAEKIEMPAVAIKLCNVCSRNLSSAG